MECYSKFMDRKTIVKISSPLNVTYRFNKIPIKIPESILWIATKLFWKDKKKLIANIILKKENKVGELTLSDFTYYKATVIKSVVLAIDT